MNLLHTRFLDVDRPRESIALLLAFASLAVVGAAWSFEYLGFVPCKLCLIQRQPYYMAIPIALVAWGVERIAGPRWVTRLLLVVLAGLYLWGGSVGFYQAGAEWGYWPGPADCAGGGATIPTAASDLLGSLSKVKVVDCTKAQIRILGLSFAGWNVLASTGLVSAAVLGVLLPDRARR
ncbi:MAG: disulfide bond formation protein B [Siculibacillus sp.]|nr:disulfide bond formation protein B [Siculibacillus sp.]